MHLAQQLAITSGALWQHDTYDRTNAWLAEHVTLAAMLLGNGFGERKANLR